MKITAHIHEGFLEQKLEGRLDAYWADHFTTCVLTAVREGHHHIRLDMTDVDYLSSAGIGALVKCLKELKAIDGSFLISRPSKCVSDMLRMTGLDQIFIAEKSAMTRQSASAEQAVVIPLPGATLEILPYVLGATVACRLTGRRSPWEPADPSECRKLALTPSTFGIGLGAPGRDFEDCRERFGEFVAAAGCVAYLPTDAGQVPDYMLSAEQFVPEMQTLSSLICEGPFSHLIRFDSTAGATVSLETLAEESLRALDTEMVGMVLVAEVEGLVGAALRRSPAMIETPMEPMQFPQVRDWLTFTSERAFAHCVALVTGVATRSGGTNLGDVVRPIGRADGPHGHFHAVAFSYRPLPKGRIDLHETVRRLFESESPRGVLHLLNDDRDVIGSGQTELRRGACWVAPIASVIQEKL